MTVKADLSGKVALVTGASSGIGRGVAIELAKSGCHVFINFPPNEGQDAAYRVKTEIHNNGGLA